MNKETQQLLYVELPLLISRILKTGGHGINGGPKVLLKLNALIKVITDAELEAAKETYKKVYIERNIPNEPHL